MLIFISGGVRSGKSALGESIISNMPAGRKVYLATSEAYDEEMSERIAKHKRDRAGKGFFTIERSRSIGQAAELLESGDAVLLDCLGTLVANEMFSGEITLFSRENIDSLVQCIFEDVLRVSRAASVLAVISNDVFSDGVRYEKTTEDYIEVLGRLHQMLAAEADEVIECVYGTAIRHKSINGEGRN